MKTKIACVQMQSALGKKRENLEKMKEKIRLIMEDKEAVSYTHLDVYKRQGIFLYTTEKSENGKRAK